MSEFNKFNELRAKHPRFIYHSFELNENELVFHFQIDKFHFHPTWRFNLNLDEYKFDRGQAEFIAITLGMAAVSKTHQTLPTNTSSSRSRWSPYH